MATLITARDFKSLPKWAQNHIAEQQEQIDQLTAVNSELSGDQPTSIQASATLDRSKGIAPINIPSKHAVAFDLSDSQHRFHSTSIRAKIEDGKLVILADWALDIEMLSSNNIKLKFRQ